MAKQTHTYITKSLVFIAVLVLFASCKKNPTAPAIKPFAMGPSVTIEKLRHLYDSVQTNIKFSSNTILTVVITADETSGQQYKEVYVRDYSGLFSATNYYGAISLHFTHGTDGVLNQGDSVAFNLNGATLELSSGGSLEIDSITYFNWSKLKTGLNPQPLVVTIPQLSTYSTVPGTANKRFIYDGQLVQLNNIEFINANVGTSYAIPQAPPAAPVNINKYINDFFGNTIVAYNSGYANFAAQAIPNHSGTITAISNLYTTMQLNIRSFQDISLTGSYNQVIYDTITQNFSSEALSSKTQIMAAGWQTFDLQGNLFWEGSQYGIYPNYKYSPSASNYKSNTVRNDIWLISPPIKDYNYTNPGAGYSKRVDFSTGLTYGTNDRLLSVLVSNTYDGVHLDPSQWTDLSAGTSPIFPNIVVGSGASGTPSVYASTHGGGGLFAPNLQTISVGSGTVTSQPYFYIAFRYQSNTNYVDSTGCTYLLGTLILKN